MRIGQKVTQIRPIAWLGYYDEAHPQFGIVYTVRAINLHEGEYYLVFFEIRNRVYPYLDGTFEMDYCAKCFAPVVERETDISIFTDMLTDILVGVE